MKTTTMTSKQRLLAALRGEPVDRPPIWLREGFPITNGPGGADDFARCWQAEPLYRELFEHVRPHCDDFVGWGIPNHNRTLMIPYGEHWRSETLVDDGRLRQVRTTISTPRGELTAVDEWRRGECTTWHVKPLIESVEELEMLMEVPWVLERERAEQGRASYNAARERAGDAQALRGVVSSPIVCISGCMDFSLFLELSLSERGLMHELCAEVTRRWLAVLEAVWGDETFETTMNIGGSEQCTPPMMRPEAFDEYVVPYEGQLVRWLNDRGVPVNCHCHGKVRHALRGMVEMGCASTDPVEPPPAGDCTIAEARAIVGDELTLRGNVEWDELCFAEPARIRERVREIMAVGPERLIIAASAGPISAIDERLARNYRTLVDTVLEY